MILSIGQNVIIKHQNVSVSHVDDTIWRLHINNVQESDSGWYTCRVNTGPMLRESGFLKVIGELSIRSMFGV